MRISSETEKQIALGASPKGKSGAVAVSTSSSSSSVEEALLLAQEEARVLQEVQEQLRGVEAENVQVRYEYVMGSDGKRYIAAAHVTFREKRDSAEIGEAEAASGKSEKSGKNSSIYSEDPEVQSAIKELQRTDREVRAHEAAHMAVGGQYAGAATYSYTLGPDGKRYAVGGEVSISAPGGDTPEETLQIMQQVQAAALAPGSPSGQDLRVAAMAANAAAQARSELYSGKENSLEETEEEAPSLENSIEKEGFPKLSRDEEEQQGLLLVPKAFFQAYEGPWITGHSERSSWSMAV